MQLVVRVSPEVADALRRGEPTDAAEAIRDAAAAAGVELLPPHPGVDDPVLARWFGARVTDPGAGRRLADQLLALDGVEAAYVKPGEQSATPNAAGAG